MRLLCALALGSLIGCAGRTHKLENRAIPKATAPAPVATPITFAPPPRLPPPRPLRVLARGCDIRLAGVDSFFYVSDASGTRRTLRLKEDGTIDRSFAKEGDVFGHFPAPLFFDGNKGIGRWDGHTLKRERRPPKTSRIEWKPWVDNTWLRVEYSYERRVTLVVDETNQPPPALRLLPPGRLLSGHVDSVRVVPETGTIIAEAEICPSPPHRPGEIAVTCTMIGNVSEAYFTEDPAFASDLLDPDFRYLSGNFAADGWALEAPTRPTVFTGGRRFARTRRASGYLSGPLRTWADVIFDGRAYFVVYPNGQLYSKESRQGAEWRLVTDLHLKDFGVPALIPSAAFSDAIYIAEPSLGKPHDRAFRVYDGETVELDLSATAGAAVTTPTFSTDERGNAWGLLLVTGTNHYEELTLTNAPVDHTFTCKELLAD